MSKNTFVGSDFDAFLEKEGILEEVQAAAIAQVIADLIKEEIQQSH